MSEHNNSHLVSFQLPSGGSSIPAGIKRQEITQTIHEWSSKWDIYPTFGTASLSVHCYFKTPDEYAVFKITYPNKYPHTVMTPNDRGVYVNYDKC
jgi:hypothetical protein|tara:strand:+ start:436 stop:720 length:285 start_codon:yes stop_codon:yes gene_type:complete